MNYCEICGCEAPSKKASLYKQTGMLIVRQTQTLSGTMCKTCMSKNALSYTGWNLLLGWWGVISLIFNPFYIMINLAHFCRSLGMEAPPKDASPPLLKEETIELLSPYIPRMNELFTKNFKLVAVAEKVARESGADPVQAIAFINQLAVR